MAPRSLLAMLRAGSLRECLRPGVPALGRLQGAAPASLATYRCLSTTSPATPQPSSSEPYDVIIVGGGMVGAAVAALLGEQGPLSGRTGFQVHEVWLGKGWCGLPLSWCCGPQAPPA
jgi:hypothetical protein